MQEGSVLHLCTKFEADCSIRSKVIKGSQKLEIRSYDPGLAHLGIVLTFMIRMHREGLSSMSVAVPHFKQIALFVPHLLLGHTIWKLCHVTLSREPLKPEMLNKCRNPSTHTCCRISYF